MSELTKQQIVDDEQVGKTKSRSRLPEFNSDSTTTRDRAPNTLGKNGTSGSKLGRTLHLDLLAVLARRLVGSEPIAMVYEPFPESDKQSNQPKNRLSKQ